METVDIILGIMALIIVVMAYWLVKLDNENEDRKGYIKRIEKRIDQLEMGDSDGR